MLNDLFDLLFLMNFGFIRQYLLELIADNDGSLFILLHQCRVALDIGEDDADFLARAAQEQRIGVEPVDDRRRHHALEDLVLALQTLLLGDVVENDGQALGGVVAVLERGHVQRPIQRAAARQVLADTLEVSRVTTFSRAHAAEMSNAAQELFRLAAVDAAYRPVATELSAAAALMTSGTRDDVRARLDRAATALASVVGQRLPPAPVAGADLSGAALRGALDDALRKPGGIK